MKKVDVKMLVATAFNGPKKPGDIISVPEATAKRWAKLGIAEIIDVVEEDEVVEEEVVEADVEETEEELVQAVDYESMPGKALFDLCKEKGIEVEARQPKAYYIEKLTAKVEE